MLATVVTAAALAAVWLLAVPREVVCPAIYPAPPGCSTQDRVATATVWTVVLLVAWAATVAAGRLRNRVVPSLLVAATIALALAAYVGTLYSTGFVIGLGAAASTLGT